MAALELPMLTLELHVGIAVLLRQDMSIGDIARKFSCSLQTVRRYIRTQDSLAKAHYSARIPRPGKLNPFKPYILERDVYGDGRHCWLSPKSTVYSPGMQALSRKDQGQS